MTLGRSQGQTLGMKQEAILGAVTRSRGRRDRVRATAARNETVHLLVKRRGAPTLVGVHTPEVRRHSDSAEEDQVGLVRQATTTMEAAGVPEGVLARTSSTRATPTGAEGSDDLDAQGMETRWRTFCVHLLQFSSSR